MRRVVVGVDSSTQSCKVEARDIGTGVVLATGSAPHPPTSPPVSEQDPAAWWAALTEAFQQLGAVRDDVVAVSIAGQQHGLVLLGDDGVPLRKAKLWNDTTSAPQAERLVAAFGADRWAAATGSRPVAAFTVSKLAWVAEHEPELIEMVAMVMLPHDYLTWMLLGGVGQPTTDRGDASGAGWFDPVANTYLSEMLDAAGVDGSAWIRKLPRVVGPAEAAGAAGTGAAAQLGLRGHVLVGAGTGDNMGAALGLGMRSGDVVVSLGTSGTVFAVSSTSTSDPSGAVAGFASATGDYLPLVCTLNATKVTDTVARWLGADAAELSRLAMTAVDDPGAVIVLPYFDGERTPNLPDATGTFVGVTNTTTRAQLALAAHDGVLCGLLDGLDALTAVGGSVGGRLFLVGGGARSVAYRQRLADLSGRSVTIPDTDETVATGAAVQAAVVATGDSFAAVAQRWALGRGTTIDPQRDAAARRSLYATASR